MKKIFLFAALFAGVGVCGGAFAGWGEEPNTNVKTLLQQDAEEDKILEEIEQRGNAFCLIRYPKIANGGRYDAISYWQCRANYMSREIVRLDLQQYYNSDRLAQYVQEFIAASAYIEGSQRK